MIKHTLSKFSTNKSLVILALFTIALALTACGGGGSSNPAGPLPDATEDQVLKANYPTVSAAYTDMRSVLENDADPVASRVATFMSYIADDFKDIAGSANKKDELASYTTSRLERYNVNSYELTPIDHVEKSTGGVATDTLEITTRISINVTLKPGASGAFTSATYPAEDRLVTWKLQDDGKTWKVYQGLPYKTSELNF